MPKITIPAHLDVDGLRDAFAKEWSAHMQNGGQSETVAQRKAYRRQIIEQLSKQFPREIDLIRYSQKELGKLGFPLPKNWNRRVPHGALVGHAINASLGNAKATTPKSEGGRPKGSKNKPKETPVVKYDMTLLTERYENCIHRAGWVPTDDVASALLGVEPEWIFKLRVDRLTNYIFENDEVGGRLIGYTVRENPTPTLIERIKEKLSTLRAEELKALDELL